MALQELLAPRTQGSSGPFSQSMGQFPHREHLALNEQKQDNL